MRNRHVGNIGDFGKLALLRHLMESRRLAVCWYLTTGDGENKHHETYCEYLKRSGEFHHLAPEIFDALRNIINTGFTDSRDVAALETRGLLDGALFHREEVPTLDALCQKWSEELIITVCRADLVFLDPDNGIQGTRLTPKQSGSEIAALRRDDRALVIFQRHSGRRSEPKFLADRLRSLGCRRIEFLHFRLASPRFYVIADHDAETSKRTAEFAGKVGKLGQDLPLLDTTNKET